MNTRGRENASKTPLATTKTPLATTKQGESKPKLKTAAGDQKEPVASSKPEKGVEDVPSGESDSNSSSGEDDEDEEEAVAGEVAVPLNDGNGDDFSAAPNTEGDRETSISGLNKIRLENSLPPSQSNEDLIDHSNLNYVQKDKIHKRRRRSSQSPSARGEGPSQSKGKGPDPRNWAGAQDISEEEIRAQQAILDEAALIKQARFEQNDIEDDVHWHGDNMARTQVKNHKVDKHKYPNKERRDTGAKRISAASKGVLEIISISTAGRSARKRSSSRNSKKGKKRSSQKKKAIPRPVEQIDKLSYINDAFARTRKLDARKRSHKDAPSDSESSDSDSSEGGRSSSSPNSTDESSDDGYDTPSEDPSDNSDEESLDGKGSRPKKSGWKAIPPPIYDGTPSMSRFHQFMLSSIMFLDDAGVPRNRRVYRLHTFLKGKAYAFYAQEVSFNVTKWTTNKFFEGLFNACFPVDFKERQREKLENFKQNNMEIRSYWSQLIELFLTTGVRKDREKARYFWSGLRPETKLRLRYDGISPENSTLSRMIRKAENAELALKLQRAQAADNERKGRKDQPSEGSSRSSKRFKGKRESHFGRKTNGYTSENTSNKEKNRKVFQKSEQIRRDFKDKSNRAKLSAEEKSRLKAEGKCYICKEATNPPHMARNCPKANSVNQKGSRSAGIQSFGVYVDNTSTEEYIDLEDTTEAAHEISLNMMGWAPEDDLVYDSDTPEFDEVNKRETWGDEVNRVLNEFHSEDELLPSENPFQTRLGFGNRPSSMDSWPSLEECEPPFSKSPWAGAAIGDPVKESIEGRLARGARYAQDRRHGALNRHRFQAIRTEGGYTVFDEHHERLEGEIFLPWNLARKPQFNVADWYQKQLNEIFGAPRDSNNKLKRQWDSEDAISEAIDLFLQVGGPFIGEEHRVFDSCARFRVSYDEISGDYVIVDHALQYKTMLKAKLLWDVDFSVTNWYNQSLKRAYFDLWANIQLCWPDELVFADDFDEEDPKEILDFLEREAIDQDHSEWVTLGDLALVTHVGGAPEEWGMYPAIQLSKELVSGMVILASIITANRFKDLERNSASRKDVSRHIPEPVTIVARIGGRPVRALLDSGSLGDFMSSSLADQLNVTKVELAKPLGIQLAVQGSRTKVNYGTKASFEYQQIREERYFDIINLQNYDLILGTPFMHQHRVAIGLNPNRVVIGSNEPLPLKGNGVKVLSSQAMDAIEDQLERARQEIREYAEPICKKAGETDLPPLRKINHRIPLIDPTKRYHWRASKCPEPLLPQWVEKRNEYVRTGRWVPCTSFNTVPMLCIPKPGKKGEAPKLRTVIDLRERNANTRKLTCPLPDMESILRRVAKAKYRSIVDGKDAYEQIRIEPDDVQYSAMATPDGPMLSKVMQQGDCNAVATFQTIMTSLFSPWLGKWIDVYLDDIVIYSPTLREHVTHCKKVIDILQRERFFLNREKLQLCCNEMQILGRVVDDQGIRMDPEKVDALVRWKTPTNRELLRGFLGAASYLADDIAKVRVPMGILFNLTSDKVPFRWDFTHQRAFDDVKHLATACRDHRRAPLQYGPNADPINVVTDACASGIAGVVSQGVDWKTARVAAFFSAKLNKAQQNYPVHELEMLAGLETMLRHRDILQGARFTWYTDHKGLKHLLEQRDLSGRQARWMEKMSGFDFKVEYVPGSENVLSDALSRIYAFDAPGTVRARSEYTDHDVVSNDGLYKHDVTMPVYVGHEARMAVLAPAVVQQPLESNAITRSQTRPVGVVTAKTALAKGSRLNVSSQDVYRRVAKKDAVMTSKSQNNRLRNGSKRRVQMTTSPTGASQQPKAQRAKAPVLGAESGRPETGREFAARMRDRFVLKGPRDPKEGEGAINKEVLKEHKKAPTSETPEDAPASLVNVVRNTQGIDLQSVLKAMYAQDPFFKIILESPKDYRNFEVEHQEKPIFPRDALGISRTSQDVPGQPGLQGS